MKYTEGLLFTLATIAVFIGIYRFYYHFIYRRNVNYARKLSTPKRILHILSWLFTFAFLGIAAYLFIIPAEANSDKEPFIWDDYTKPFVIVFDKPVRHSSVTHSFSKEIKGTWTFEKVNEYDIFKRKLVFYPAESLLPNEKVSFTSDYTLLLGMNTLKLKSELHGGTETPNVKINDEVDDKQNVNPDQEIRVSLEQGNPLSYVLNFESTPPGLFDETKRYRAQENNTIIPHNGLKNGQLYDTKIYLTPVSYNLNTREIIGFGEKKLLKSFKFQTANTPLVKEILPKGDSVLSSEKIQISFYQEMDKESVEKGITFDPAIDGGHFEWSEDSTRINYVTDKPLQKEAKYRILLANTIKSHYGAKLSQVEDTKPAITHEFKTIGSVGVAGTTPASGTYNVDPAKTVISIIFNQEVDKPSAESKFSVSPAIDGKITWDGTTMNFKPNSEIKSAMKYTVTLAPGIKSVEGLDLKSSYSFTFTTKSKTVLLKAPIINQPAQFACNVTAAAIALQFKGVNVSPWDVYNGIPKQTAPKTVNSWGNPNLGYVGNIYGAYGGDRTDGYGVYWDPIKNYISKYRPAEVKRGWNVTDMLNEIDKGNLSILWWQNGYATPTQLSWTAPDGSKVTGVNGMHSEVVVGYIGSPENPSQIILSDPWASRWNNQYRYININQFNGLWGYFNNTAVVVR